MGRGPQVCAGLRNTSRQTAAAQHMPASSQCVLQIPWLPPIGSYVFAPDSVVETQPESAASTPWGIPKPGLALTPSEYAELIGSFRQYISWPDALTSLGVYDDIYGVTNGLVGHARSPWSWQ